MLSASFHFETCIYCHYYCYMVSDMHLLLLLHGVGPSAWTPYEGANKPNGKFHLAQPCLWSWFFPGHRRKDPEDWLYGNPWEMTRDCSAGPPQLPDLQTALATANKAGHPVLAAPWTFIGRAVAEQAVRRGPAKRKRQGYVQSCRQQRTRHGLHA